MGRAPDNPRACQADCGLKVPLATCEVSGLSRGQPGARSILDLRKDLLRDSGVFFEVIAELVVEDRLDEASDFARAELGLRLTLEFRLGQLHRYHCRETFARVVPPIASPESLPFFFWLVR